MIKLLIDAVKPQRDAIGPWLGYVSLLPFIFGAILHLAGIDIAFAIRAYAALILSFLGGVQWGIAVSAEKQSGAPPADRLMLSVLPSLVGWGALLLSNRWGIILLIAALILQWLWDQMLSTTELVSDWYAPLRTKLSIVVVICLAVFLT